MPNLCLNMIVKNEAARIVRALESAAPHITHWVIADTGSTDKTPELIETFFKDHGIPGRLVRTQFKDFSQARNEALEAARKFRTEATFDYLLLMDADMELRVLDDTWKDHLDGIAYDVYQTDGALVYQNRRLLRVDVPANYRCVTHEFLDVATAGVIPRDKMFFQDYADGANRTDKFKRDIALIKEALKTEPNNERYFYYLAQSYRDAGKHEKALKWYKRRVKAGGWEEEQWHAQLCVASCYLDLKDEDNFVLSMMKAYNMRPSRMEAPYELAKFYRNKGQSALSVAFADAARRVKPTTDGLFVFDYPYAVGADEELSISGFYMPDRRKEMFSLTDDLSLRPSPYVMSRELARTNLFHYLEPLKNYAPSFTSRRIDFTPDAGWTAMNPSVARHGDKLKAIIRTVNYKIDEDGRYSINGNSNLGDDNPIITRNFLAELNEENVSNVRSIYEVMPDNEDPPLFKAVLGYEDMRLFKSARGLCVSSCRRDLNHEGYCEQVVSSISIGGVVPKLSVTAEQDFVMRREPRMYEKNWMPIINGPDKPLHFMYRLGHVVDANGKDVVVNPTGRQTDHISGGSQLIGFDWRYLCLTHEARLVPGKSIRYYAHRFAFFDMDYKLLKLSKPFVFDERVIEFAAGLCWHPDMERLVISYGSRDREARIATIDHREVQGLLSE